MPRKNMMLILSESGNERGKKLTNESSGTVQAQIVPAHQGAKLLETFLVVVPDRKHECLRILKIVSSRGNTRVFRKCILNYSKNLLSTEII
mmetsp:Transcript_25300/g.37452  ORF Transcript_25300/g.37452 Transcript_25300/m.37452 type:complete len:91 (+) Transcript_25300:936-1208(+)